MCLGGALSSKEAIHGQKTVGWGVKPEQRRNSAFLLCFHWFLGSVHVATTSLFQYITIEGIQ